MKRLERTALLEVPAELAFKVVADVERYPEFVPGCEAVEITNTSEDGVVARVTVSGKGITQSFVTRNTHSANQILMTLREGPFKKLEGAWRFTPIGDLGCRVDMLMEFEPKGILVRLLSGLADTLADRLVDAFSRRIEDVSTGQA